MNKKPRIQNGSKRNLRLRDLTSRRSQCIANHCGIGLYENRVNSVLSFSLALLMALQVTTIRTTTLGLTRCGDRKPLLNSLVRLLLRHGRFSSNSKAKTPDFTGFSSSSRKRGGEYRRRSIEVSSQTARKSNSISTIVGYAGKNQRPQSSKFPREIARPLRSWPQRRSLEIFCSQPIRKLCQKSRNFDQTMA